MSEKELNGELQEVAINEKSLIVDVDGLEKLKAAGADTEELVRALVKIANEDTDKAEQIATEYAEENSAPEILDAFHDAVSNKNK